MTAKQIIRELQAKLNIPHAIAVRCQVDNFTDRRNTRLYYEVYVDQSEDFVGGHVQGQTLEESYEKMVAYINLNQNPIPVPADEPDSQCPVVEFATRSGDEQDNTDESDRPIEDTDSESQS